MYKLQVIEQREVLGKQFRVYGDIENPLFLAKDVAEWIEHSDVSMMMKSVDEFEKLIQTMLVSGQSREMWFLTEDGLMEVLFQSRKPIAKEFKRQVKEILKTIRKTGRFEIANKEKTKEVLAEAKMKNADARLLAAKTKQSELMISVAEKFNLSSVSKELIAAKAIEFIVGESFLPLPQIEKQYSATQIAQEAGVSAAKVGRIANAKGIKTEENGMYVLDKSRHSDKQVETFVYNERGKKLLLELLEV